MNFVHLCARDNLQRAFMCFFIYTIPLYRLIVNDSGAALIICCPHTDVLRVILRLSAESSKGYGSL